MAESGGYNEMEHFPSFDDRVRTSRASMSRSPRAVSPTHSAHGSLLRTSLLQISAEKKARKVRFYRNGDMFFKGMVYAVSGERFRTFESLMAELTTSPLCDKNVMPNGVRCIFSLDGTKKILTLDQLEEGESYVCASTNVFRRIDYPKSNTPCWNVNPRSDSLDSKSPIFDDGSEKDFIRPKLVTIIRNGAKPRKAVRVLLNKKTAHSFDQVLTDITEAIKLDTGAVRKIFTTDGRPITCLADFFRDENVFVAYGQEKYSLDDFDLDGNEVKFVNAYRSVRQKERVTLKSPKPPRRVLSSSTSYNNNQYEIPKRMTPPANQKPTSNPGSPITMRKTRPKSPGHLPLTNGLSQNGHTNGGHKGNGNLTFKYKIGKIIGEGNFAVVKECQDKTTMKNFALKMISREKCQGKEQMIENETSILRRVKHPNIIQLVEEFDTADEICLIMEYVRGGDLFDAISTATKYTERDASGMLYNLASAIQYLHSLHIVHRDIKPENILVCEHNDGSLSLKLGDFGLATVVKDGQLFTVCGTPTYVAPEVLAETGYGLSVDVWASGVITYILLCGFPPFFSATNNQEELFDKIIGGKFEFTSPFWDDMSDSAKDLISHMLQVDVGERISASDVLAHPWVADDMAKDEDLHTSVSHQLDESFTRKGKKSCSTAGINLLATTAMDKASRYFQGRGNVPPLNQYQNGDEDEVF